MGGGVADSRSRCAGDGRWRRGAGGGALAAGRWRQAERALAEERERLRTTLRAIGEAVIATDALGQVTYLNAAAERLIGQSLEEIAGRRLDEVVVLTSSVTLKVTSSMFAASPVSGPDGALSGVVVVLQDATTDVLGGDEFAILLPQSEPSRAELVGGKVLRAVSDLVVEWNGASHNVGASIGVAALVPAMGTVRAWVAAADNACYEAKRAGRGQMRIAA